MTYILFIAITGATGILGGLLFSIKSDWPLGRLMLPILSLLIVLTGYMEFFASLYSNPSVRTALINTSVVLHFLIALSLLELTLSFLGHDGIGSFISMGSRPIRLRIFWRSAIIFILFSIFSMQWFEYRTIDSGTLVQLNLIGEILFVILFCYHLLTLYIVEKIFRNATTMQKRIFVLYLASTGLIALGSMVMLVRILFYQFLSFEIIRIHIALCAVFFPGIIIGLMRYRLWNEQIVIGRGMVYTSITILFFGLFLVFLGLIAFAVRLLGIHFDEFEEFVFLFSFLFLGIITIFSPHMRKTITALTKKYIYKSKYDYRDQLLRLHSAHQTTGDVQRTIQALIDNLRFTIIVGNASVFLRSPAENYFHSFDEPAFPSQEKTILRADSLLIGLFEDNTADAIEIDKPAAEVIRVAVEKELSTLRKLSISHLFPIRHEENLLGILLISAKNRHFDSEDLMIIRMFSESVGTAIFRDRIQRERIEQKQFESFNHMASFIVHDIKNQIATLSLVTKNAHANIGNPEFHPLLLRSLENCSGNLDNLIKRLQSPPKKELLSKTLFNCNDIVRSVIEQAGLGLPSHISIRTELSEIPLVSADATALSYILDNLIINAIEAIGKKEGMISCATGALTSMVHEDTCRFGLTVFERECHLVFIVIEDNGPGMSGQFIEQRLFKPFNSTKEKGIGIGLYQCKTLIDSMGGRLLCWSEEGKGTRFCILL